MIFLILHQVRFKHKEYEDTYTHGQGTDNARESLYTLVRRLKPIVESNSNVKIVSDKGGYALATKKILIVSIMSDKYQFVYVPDFTTL